MSGILFFIFASCHPLTQSLMGARTLHLVDSVFLYTGTKYTQNTSISNLILKKKKKKTYRYSQCEVVSAEGNKMFNTNLSNAAVTDRKYCTVNTTKSRIIEVSYLYEAKYDESESPIFSGINSTNS